MGESIRRPGCPRSGYVELFAKSGGSYVVRTSCKTWGCKVCRNKRSGYVQAMMERGCSTLKPCYLITLTLRAGSEETHVASFVAAAWARLLRTLKKRSPNLTWFRVIEATKKGTPHLHLIVGNLGQRVANSHGKYPRYSEKFIRKECKEDCLIHEWGLIWFQETTAFVVDVAQIYDAAGASRYLGKYLVKGFLDRTRLQALGYERRFTMARNWPRGDQIKLAGSYSDSWDRIVVLPGWYRPEEMERRALLDQGRSLVQSVGDPVTLDIRERGLKKSKISEVERMKDAIL